MIKSLIFCVFALTPMSISQILIDPADKNLDTLALLAKYNYTTETHEVTTDDGYNLVLHRVLSKQNNPNPKVIFLNHGFIASSYHFVNRGPRDALAYVLADAGYDVWMPNNRGNGVSMTATGAAANNFWDFSLDDIGKYDGPALIDYVLAKTKQSDLTFIGHSQGCTMYYIMCLERPEYEAKINKFIALAPLFSMRHVTSIYAFGPMIGQFSPFSETYFDIGKQMGNTTRNICVETKMYYTCRLLYISLNGGTTKEIPIELFKMIVNANYPASSSSKNMLHIAQWVGKNNIAKYDYGRTVNLQKYGSEKAPIYNLTIPELNPKYVFYGIADKTITPKSVEFALKQMSNVKRVFMIDGYGHNCLTMGWSVNSIVNSNILTILNES